MVTFFVRRFARTVFVLAVTTSGALVAVSSVAAFVYVLVLADLVSALLDPRIRTDG